MCKVCRTAHTAGRFFPSLCKGAPSCIHHCKHSTRPHPIQDQEAENLTWEGLLPLSARASNFAGLLWRANVETKLYQTRTCRVFYKTNAPRSSTWPLRHARRHALFRPYALSSLRTSHFPSATVLCEHVPIRALVPNLVSLLNLSAQVLLHWSPCSRRSPLLVREKLGLFSVKSPAW